MPSLVGSEMCIRDRGYPPWLSSSCWSSSFYYATARISGQIAGHEEPSCTTSCTRSTDQLQVRNQCGWDIRSTRLQWRTTSPPRQHRQSQWLPTRLPLQPLQLRERSLTPPKPASERMHQACPAPTQDPEGSPASEPPTRRWLPTPQPRCPSREARSSQTSVSQESGKDPQPPLPDPGQGQQQSTVQLNSPRPKRPQGQELPQELSHMSPSKEGRSTTYTSSPASSPPAAPSPPWQEPNPAIPSPLIASRNCEAQCKKKEEEPKEKKMKKDSNKFRKLFSMKSF